MEYVIHHVIKIESPSNMTVDFDENSTISTAVTVPENEDDVEITRKLVKTVIDEKLAVDKFTQKRQQYGQTEKFIATAKLKRILDEYHLPQPTYTDAGQNDDGDFVFLCKVLFHKTGGASSSKNKAKIAAADNMFRLNIDELDKIKQMTEGGTKLLNELVQKLNIPHPTYTDSGKNSDGNFVIACELFGVRLEGYSVSKKSAKHMASYKVLKMLECVDLMMNDLNKSDENIKCKTIIPESKEDFMAHLQAYSSYRYEVILREPYTMILKFDDIINTIYFGNGETEDDALMSVLKSAYEGIAKLM